MMQTVIGLYPLFNILAWPFSGSRARYNIKGLSALPRQGVKLTFTKVNKSWGIFFKLYFILQNKFSATKAFAKIYLGFWCCLLLSPLVLWPGRPVSTRLKAGAKELRNGRKVKEFWQLVFTSALMYPKPHCTIWSDVYPRPCKYSRVAFPSSLNRAFRAAFIAFSLFASFLFLLYSASLSLLIYSIFSRPCK